MSKTMNGASRLRLHHAARAAAAMLVGALALTWHPGAAFAQDFFGDGFETFTGIPPDSAREIAEPELDDLRGGFLGFFFSVSFSGVVEVDGASTGVLVVSASLGDESGEVVVDAGAGSESGADDSSAAGSAEGAEVFSSAIIGEGFAGAEGIFQISQIPGDLNSVRQMLVINLAVIQATESDFGALRSQLAPIFGL
jgi:hypothetical protein